MSGARTVADVIDELDNALADMPEQVVRDVLAERGLDYDEVAESGLRFIEGLKAEQAPESAAASPVADDRRPTLEEIRALLEQADGDTVEITVVRNHPPARGATIRVVADVDGKPRRGPMSSSDATVVHAGGRRWTSRWWVADLRRWVKKMDFGR